MKKLPKFELNIPWTFKFDLKMKLSLLFLLTTMFAMQAHSSYSQATKISLNMKNVTVGEIIDEIEAKTEFKFLFNTKAIDLNRIVSLKVKKKQIDTILNQLLAGTQTSYEIDNRKVLLHKVTDKESLEENRAIEDKDSQQQQVSGTVTDENGNPLPGANIVEKGTSNGVIADFDGKFSLSLKSSDAVLVVSYLGYATMEIIPVGNQDTIKITLAENLSNLDEVVVVGYGAVKKSDLTGSVVSVTSDEITAYPQGGITSALQGRASGVVVQSNNGGPGSSTRIRIRGGTSINASSDPLYVVDGFPGGSVPPNEDIESIEILKDASATAIYGSRGANGVVLITTKRGKSGKTIISLNTSYSSQKEIGRYDLLETPDYIALQNELTPGKYDPNGTYENTDWQDKVLTNGHIKNYQLSVSGGNEKAKYYVSGIIFDNKGTIINSDFKRYSLTSNLDIQLRDNLKLGVNLLGRSSKTDGVRTQEAVGGSGGTGVISSAVKMEPIIGVFNEDGSYQVSQNGDRFDNPVAIALETLNETVRDNMQANMFVEWELLKGLRWRSSFGYKFSESRFGSYLPTTLNSGALVNGSAQLEFNRNKNFVSEHYLTYNKNINDVHDFTVLGGFSYQSSKNEFLRAETQDFITDSSVFWNLGSGAATQTSTSNLTDSELESFYGRLNYKLLDRYLLTFTARYDGSSRFAINNKWAFFPSAAIAWNVSNEPFMESVETVSQLKFRGTWGVTGNQAIAPYQSLAQFSSIGSTVIDDQLVNGVITGSVANDNLTWESTTQTNIGIDLGLFGQRIVLVADYYTMKTEDLLFRLPLPEYSGYSSLWSNIGVVENKGFEFTLSTLNLDGEFKWTTDISFSKNKNKVLELPDGEDIFLSTAPGHMVGLGASQVIREGSPVGSFYGFVYDGVYQEGDTFIPGGEQAAGGEKFKDINGRDAEGELTGQPDGELTSADRTIIGNPTPDFTLGFNNTFEYKGIDFNIFFYTSQGNDVYSWTLYELDHLWGGNNSTTNVLNRWTPSNTNTDVPAANPNRGRRSSNRFIYDGSFIRLKNLALGYTFSDSITERMGMSKARVYVSGQNLWTITNYPGVDPEVNYLSGGASAGNTNLGFDYGSYPNVKSFTLGVQLSF